MRNLPKGVRIDRGYVEVRIMRKGHYYHKKFGRDCPLARELASIHASEKYKEILLGAFGIKKEPARLSFPKAADLFFKRHYEEYRDASTNQPRSDGSKCTARAMLNTLSTFFGTLSLDEIKVRHVKEYKVQRLDVDKVSNATFNRERGVLSALFNQFHAWVSDESLDPIKLPLDPSGAFLNPAEAISVLLENKRERIADTWELAEAYNWCQTHDSGLWEAIEKALLTALRKQDLVALDGSLTVKGIQQKSGEKFDLPITLDRPVDLTNYKRRWDALRKALGWLPNPKGQPLNPKHTTWHDLRHWAPTLLGEQGFSIKIIQRYTGHKKEETAERYTNIRRKSLEPAVQVVRDAIERIKTGE